VLERVSIEREEKEEKPYHEIDWRKTQYDGKKGQGGRTGGGLHHQGEKTKRVGAAA